MSRLSSELIDQAELLAKKERLRPKEASLRRAISTAYYALFHFLLEETTRLIVGAGPTDKDTRQLLARAGVHGIMKRACQDVAKPRLSGLLDPVYQAMGATGTAELSIAGIFVELQDVRHEADYNTSASAKFRRADALQHVQDVRLAFKAWNTLKAGNRPKAQFFALLLFHFEGLSKRK